MKQNYSDYKTFMGFQSDNGVGHSDNDSGGDYGMNSESSTGAMNRALTVSFGSNHANLLSGFDVKTGAGDTSRSQLSAMRRRSNKGS